MTTLAIAMCGTLTGVILALLLINIRRAEPAIRERRNRLIESAMQGLLAGGMWNGQSESELVFDAKRVADAIMEETDK